MKIGIAAQKIFRKEKHGMDIVALELIKNLQKIDLENEYVIFVAPGPDRCIKETHNFKICEFKGFAYPFWEQFFLPRKIKAENCDIIHCTSNTAPFFLSIPLVLTLHDIIYLKDARLWRTKGTWYQIFGNLYRHLVVPGIIKKCKKIITVSDFEKQNIEKYIGLSQKLTFIYNGVSNHFKKDINNKIIEDVKKKYHLPKNYILFLGNTAPKKNTKNVLKAYSEFVSMAGNDYKLVVLDYKKNYLQKILNQIGAPNLKEHIQLLGYVTNVDLPAIINQSKIFMYPSIYESFGIPILESMACGTPVITSKTTSMPEIAGDAAILTDPLNPGEIASAIYKLVNDTGLRNTLIKKGLVRVKKFSWENTATKYLEIYNAAK